MPARRVPICLIFAALWAFAANAPAPAQGLIVPRPCQRCPGPIPPRPVPLPRALPIKSITIDTKINGQVATTHLEQVFRNDTDTTLEGTYFFPIPEAASIVEFAIWDGNNRLVGEVRSREEARRIYDEIVRRQRDPGLLEYAGKDLFQASIFPIPPRSDKKLELTYTQVLRAESGTVSYRYPLGTGRQLAPIGRVAGCVEIEGREPLRNIYSPSHAIDVARMDSDRRARLTFESKSGEEPQDFQLFYTLSRDDFGLSLLTYREPGKDGYFLLSISPKSDWSEAEYAAKDIVFVLDTSGSMAEAGKMDKARAALIFGIRGLRPADRFNVISFAGEERLMASGLIPADEAGRERGLEFASRLRPTGGTNINDALLAALRQFQPGDRPRMIVFLTDGLPTVGERNITNIIENVRRAQKQGVRLFTFGVGYDVNTALLDKLAADNGGAADYVEPKEDIEVRVSNFFAKVNHPVLTHIALDMGGVETDLVYPRTLPDLFKGTQLTLIGRYRDTRGQESVRLRLTGRTGSKTREFIYDNLRFARESNQHEFLPRLWATRRVGWLMEQIRTNGEQKELRDEIVDLGTRYGIVTPYTSYLALEQNEARQITGVPISRRDQELREGAGRKDTGSFGARASAGAAPAPAADSLRVMSTTGEVAVQQSKSARARQETVRVAQEASADFVRSVGGKTFYLRDGVWTDAEYKEEAKLPATALTFGSDEYFALLKREPRLARFFALGERVVVVVEGRVYHVHAR